MAQSSFDIVSELDMQEVDNAVNQAKRELSTRFDFKGSKSSISLDKAQKKIQLIADDDMKLRNLQDMLRTRMAARKVSSKTLQFGETEQAFEGTLRQDIALVSGIEQEKAKRMIKSIKDAKFKVQASIQGEQIRVTSKSRDELQAVIQHFKESPPEIPIQFVNYR